MQLTISRWGKIAWGTSYTPPPLPPRDALLELIEACYYASLESDEGRFARFSLCFFPHDPSQQESHREKPATFLFEKARPISVEEFRRLSVASHPDASGIWISSDPSNPSSLIVNGLISLGSSWMSARKGYTTSHSPPPHALIVRVLGPGRVEVYEGPFLVSRLTSGRLSSLGSIRVMDILSSISIFSNEGLGLLSAQLRRPEPELEDPSDSINYEFITHVNAILGIVNTIQGLNHGGTLILCRQAYINDLRQQLRIKYPFLPENQPLRENFIRFMNLRHQWREHFEKANSRAKKTNTWKAELLSSRATEAGQEFSRCITIVGRLSGTDGAIVLAPDLSLIGFGAEILTGPAKSLPVFEAHNPSLEEVSELDPEQFGMRHRSAVRLVASAPGIVAYIVSQDGSISVAWQDQTRVLLRRGIEAVNIDMPM